MTCDITIPEGTTRHIVVTVKNQDGSLADLSNCSAYITINVYRKDIITKKCEVDKEEVRATIDPEYTVGCAEGKYEIRVFAGKEIYEIIRGKIEIQKSINPLLSEPQ